LKTQGLLKTGAPGRLETEKFSGGGFFTDRRKFVRRRARGSEAEPPLQIDWP